MYSPFSAALVPTAHPTPTATVAPKAATHDSPNVIIPVAIHTAPDTRPKPAVPASHAVAITAEDPILQAFESQPETKYGKNGRAKNKCRILILTMHKTLNGFCSYAPIILALTSGTSTRIYLEEEMVSTPSNIKKVSLIIMVMITTDFCKFSYFVVTSANVVTDLTFFKKESLNIDVVEKLTCNLCRSGCVAMYFTRYR